MARSSGTRHGNGSQGPGYGGPAHGGPSRPPEPFTADSPTRETVAQLDNGDVDEQAFRAAQRKKRREQREEMLQILAEIARDKAQPGMTRGTMADKLLDRIDGKPTATVNMNANIHRSVNDLTDEELAALAGDGEGEGGDGGEAEGPE